MFLDGAKLHQPGRILLPVSSSRTGCPIARSAEELSSTWPSPADITVDLDHRPNWTERIVALRLRPTVGDLGPGATRPATVPRRSGTRAGSRRVRHGDLHRRLPPRLRQLDTPARVRPVRLPADRGRIQYRRPRPVLLRRPLPAQAQVVAAVRGGRGRRHRRPGGRSVPNPGGVTVSVAGLPGV